MATGTVTLHRVVKSAPEKLFRAFSDPLAYAAWLPPYGFLGEIHSWDFRTGGTYRMSFHNFSTGSFHSFGGSFLEIVPNKLIRHTDRFENPDLPGAMITTIRLTPVSCGTDLHIVQEGIPEVIPPEMCYLGWQESLDKLIRLTDPEIPG